jgi:hypothetical protein
MAHSRKRSIAKGLIKVLNLPSIQLKLYPLSVETKFNDIELERVDSLRALFPLNLTKQVVWKRFGSRYDGGYLLIDDVTKSDVCISLGVGDNFSFDIDIAKYCHQVLMFDHTVDAPQISINNVTFNKVGISTNPTLGFTTLEQILDNIPAERDLILKIDIEGTEWDVFDSIAEEYLARFRQIIVEFHGLFQIGNSVQFQKMLNGLTKISRTHHLMNFHANNWADLHMIVGLPLPDVVEATYLRRDLADPTSYRIIPLNRTSNDPNNQDLPDYDPNFLSFVEI